jgi:putative colanic acid biosynthesis glycosyltransferase
MKVLQINTSVNSGSHGRIAEEIGRLLILRGHESYIAYGRTAKTSNSELVKIGNRIDFVFHLIKTRFFDRHGFGSLRATRLFVNHIDRINPDIIHLHNIHGYFTNIKILFEYIKKNKKSVVWTFHDCWPFTGHCSHFDRVNCIRWQSECFECPLKNGYPKSWLLDNSRNNFRQKKVLFEGINNMILVSPSYWLAEHLRHSFLKQYPIKVINNGVNLEKFRQVDPQKARTKFKIKGKYVILGVASIWRKGKGLADFVQLRSLLDSKIEIVLVGLNSGQLRSLPDGVRGISRIESIEDLALLFSTADVFVNPTYVDNFPTVNIEALACGTPVITYKTGGSPETISDDCGLIVTKGEIDSLYSAIQEILLKGKDYFSLNCRSRAVNLYNKDERILEYLNLYNALYFNNLDKL